MIRPLVCVLLSMLAAGAARAEEPCRIGIGLYVPWTGPREIEQRHALSRELASARVPGCELRGVGYLRYADYSRAVDAEELDYAVIDAAAAAASRRKYRILGYWASGQSWHLVSREDSSRLRGRTLAVPATDSPGTNWFVERVLLRGQVRAKAYFSRLVGTPTTFDSIATVRLGKADLAFVRADQRGDLRAVRDLGRWSELALVAMGDEPLEHEAAIVASMRNVVTSRMGGSWSQDGRLRGEVGLTKPVLAKPAPLTGNVWQLLSALPPPNDELPITELWMDAP